MIGRLPSGVGEAMEQVQTVVIGAGVVGLATARALARRGHEVLILEQASAFGTETSARNSEVIHAGLYYPPGSLKARLCVEGRGLLYDFLARHGVPHRRCGKLIVATSSQQEQALTAIAARAQDNGVTDLQWLTGEKARSLEPALQATAALLSPSTGIIDGHGYMLALLGEAEERGAMLALNTRLVDGRLSPAGFELDARDIGTGEHLVLRAHNLVNAAGFSAQPVASVLRGLDAAHIPPLRLAKGNYFTCRRKPPFTRLIYPVPEPGGLGIHLTLDLQGQARFGPDVEWAESADYRVDPARAARFYGEIRKYWPDLPEHALEPAYCGLRPKLGGPEDPAQDFRIDGPARHGVRGLVNLFGIESPGLTASLAIADHVAALLDR
jgi:L-2-hydroxyglutarate oxidase LhgO